tara:strand:+ start:323 stop:868 length:546 start_codon:yes stop_codon:yes gene_type:complete
MFRLVTGFFLALWNWSSFFRYTSVHLVILVGNTILGYYFVSAGMHYQVASFIAWLIHVIISYRLDKLVSFKALDAEDAYSFPVYALVELCAYFSLVPLLYMLIDGGYTHNLLYSREADSLILLSMNAGIDLAQYREWENIDYLLARGLIGSLVNGVAAFFIHKCFTFRLRRVFAWASSQRT